MYYTPEGTTYNLYAHMTEQPHLLIAGATGSGKSVVINGIMHTLLHRPFCAVENGAEFILIDPKRVELSQYKNLPHTLYYASEPEEFTRALNYAMNIIEMRYIEMQAQGIRKFNGGDVYIIIDEFADLMTTCKKHVLPLVQRIAQIGRASRVHLIIATQTPIAKVLPTEVKCNFDSRVALRTRSAQDSRNILGTKGAEELPRYGKGYYMTPDFMENVLTDIPMIPEEELDRLCAFWMAQVEENPRQTEKKVPFWKRFWS